jgi:hypothetical protein
MLSSNNFDFTWLHFTLNLHFSNLLISFLVLIISTVFHDFLLCMFQLIFLLIISICYGRYFFSCWWYLFIYLLCHQFLQWIGGILGLMLVNLMATRGGFWAVHISLLGLFALSPVEKIFLSIFMKDHHLDLSNLTGMVWQIQWCCTSWFYVIVCSLLSLDNSTWFLPTYIRNFIYVYLCIGFVIGKLILT